MIIPLNEYPVGFNASDFSLINNAVFFNPFCKAISSVFFILSGFSVTFFSKDFDDSFTETFSVPGEIQLLTTFILTYPVSKFIFGTFITVHYYVHLSMCRYYIV